MTHPLDVLADAHADGERIKMARQADAARQASIPTDTPWGAVQFTTPTLRDGVTNVHTSRHGGVYLDEPHSAMMLDACHEHTTLPMRTGWSWWEEDCAWSLVALVFPDAFTPEQRKAAYRTARDWYPDEYARITQLSVTPDESYTLRKRAFEAATRECFVGFSARGDWADDVPAGTVTLSARKVSTGEAADFNIAADDYGSRDPFGFVIDEAKHRRIGN